MISKFELLPQNNRAEEKDVGIISCLIILMNSWNYGGE